MKKGTQVQVTDEAKYPGQAMAWTEPCTGNKIIKGGEVVFHKSDAEIKAFSPKTICVSPYEHGKSYLESNATMDEVTRRFNWKKYIYAIFLPDGTEVETYSGDEYRFSLNAEMMVIFVGTVYEASLGAEIVMTPSGLKETTRYIQFSDTVKL